MVGRLRQLFRQPNLEVHQLRALGIIDTSEIDTRAFHRGGNVFDVEEKKSGLRGMGLDRLGGEL
jgi:hypothetical protein